MLVLGSAYKLCLNLWLNSELHMHGAGSKQPTEVKRLELRLDPLSNTKYFSYYFFILELSNFYSLPVENLCSLQAQFIRHILLKMSK